MVFTCVVSVPPQLGVAGLLLLRIGGLERDRWRNSRENWVGPVFVECRVTCVSMRWTTETGH